MGFRCHDRIAKIVIKRVASGRLVETEKELWAEASRADLVIRPGKPLPVWTGLLGVLIDAGIVVLEFYHGRPTLENLMRARAKVYLAGAPEARRGLAIKRVLAGALVIVTIGEPRKGLRTLFGRLEHRQVSPGHRVYEDTPPVHVVDLKQLEVTLRTAWLHVAGNGPRRKQALRILYAQGGPEVLASLDILMEEIELMSGDTQNQRFEMDREERDAMRELAALWATVKAREQWKEGRERGRREGLKHGRKLGKELGQEAGRRSGLKEGRLAEGRKAILVFVHGRFGLHDEALASSLEEIDSVRSLETLMRCAARVGSIEELCAAVLEEVEKRRARTTTLSDSTHND